VAETNENQAVMKILHVGGIEPSRSAGGQNHSIRGLAAAQAELGHSVGLLSSLPLPSGVSMEEVPGVYLLEGLHKPHYNPWLISHDWIERIRRDFGTPDIVNFHSTYIPFHTALARRCKQADWPYIITARGVMNSLALKVKRVKKSIANLLFFRSYVKNAAAIHALSSREAKEIQDLFKVKQIFTISNGVEDYLLEAREKLSPADLDDFRCPGDLMLGFVGRIDMYHKGLDLLLKAMAILKSQSGGFGCKLFVIGPFHRKRDERSFHSAVKSLGLKDDVKLLGPKYGEEKLRYFLACDVFVHTSRFEGMPMSVLEAMALGRPCLVTPGSNMGEVVHECGGWECKPNPRSIAETIKSIYEKRDSLGAIGEQSHKLMRSRFTWRQVAQQTSEEYLKLCDPK
jgi:glycosyltransferase involved in cell wall biosynthesis